MSSSVGERYELLIKPLPVGFSHGRGLAALNGLFGRFGLIARTDIRLDRSRTFACAFLEFRSQSAALQAIREVHGSLVFGRTLSVAWSALSISSFRTTLTFVPNVAEYVVRVEQQPWTREKPRIIALLASYGATRFETAKGFTFVHFAQAEAAQASIDELDGRAFGGVEVSVCWYTASSRPGNELIVRFLPLEESIRAIRTLFGEHGRLRLVPCGVGSATDDAFRNVIVVRDRNRGEPFAHAYVQFFEEADAERATDALDGHVMSRGPVRIAWAIGSSTSGHLVRIVGLAEFVDRKELQKMFSCYGELKCVHVDYDLATSRSNRKRFVTFADREPAEAAITAFGGCFLQNDDGIIRMTTGPLLRVVELDESVDEETLEKILSRYGELRNVDLEPDRSMEMSTQIGFVTFADHKEVHGVVKEIGGYFFRNGEALISLPMDRLNRELERPAAPEASPGTDGPASASASVAVPDLSTNSITHITANADRLNHDLERLATAEAASVAGASDSASARAAIPDLLTDSVIHMTADVEQVDVPEDLIDLRDPSPPTCPSAVYPPGEAGYVYTRALLMSLRSSTSL
ncbi:poly(A) binding proteincytoplasmic 1-like protein [Aphelenchoides avenae]|nr:poly(A) binding proteincytoplasmic 1-like protein [Aphelenchus avenae]